MSIAKYEKKLFCLVNQAKLISFCMAKVYKYGFEVPRNHDDAMSFNSMNKDSKLRDAENIELGQLDEYNTFEDREQGTPVPKGFKKIHIHFVYDLKHDSRHKARCVAGGHLTDIPIESVYSGVVSLRGFKMVLFLAELNRLETYATDIGNVYL